MTEKKTKAKKAKKKVALVVGNNVAHARRAAEGLDLKGREVHCGGAYSTWGGLRADEIYNVDRVLDRMPPSAADAIRRRLGPRGEVIDID